MPYSNTAAVLRADIMGKVEEASPEMTDFIADQVLPVWPSPTKSGVYPIFRAGISDLLTDDATTRARGGSYQRVIRSYDNDNFTTLDRGLEEALDDTDVKDLERFFDLEAATAVRVTNQVKIGLEQRVSDAINTTANFTATAAQVAYTQANIATIDLPQDVLNALDRLAQNGNMGNTIVMSASVWNRIRRSTLLQNYVRGSGKASDAPLNLSQDQVAQAFGLKQLLVSRAPKNTAKKPKFTASFVWPNTYVWVGRTETGDLLNGGAGRTIVWREEGGLFVVETYRNEETRSDIVRVRQHTVEKILNTKAGELITTSYS